MLLDQANDLVCISGVGGIACLRQRLGKRLGSGASKASLVAGVDQAEGCAIWPPMKTTIESVLEIVITKSCNDPKVMKLAVKVREALK